MALPMNSYISPEQAAMMAGIEDPNDRMGTMRGMQQFANQLPAMNRIKERDNGRVVGRTSLMEGLGQAGSQIAGAAMNKHMMGEYGKILDKNNESRKSTALAIAQALRDPKAGHATPLPVYTPEPTEIP